MALTGSNKKQIARGEFLRILEEVASGLSDREIIEQSSCFVFKNGKVMTFNEEVYCESPSLLEDGICGAIKAGPLLSLLRKLQEETVKVGIEKEVFVIEGKGKRTELRMEKEILLPVDVVDKPTKWKKLHEDFTDAIGIVEACASKDESAFKFTCIHIHPKHMEACDNFQLSRYLIETGVSASCLVRAQSLKEIPALDVTEFCETESWIHFRRGGDRYQISIRRHNELYEDLTPILAVTGRPAVLPKTLGEAVETAEIFTSENADEHQNQVTIELRSGALKLTGKGESGRHIEIKKLKYEGPPIKFQVAPKLLVELVKRHTRCEISDQLRLKVSSGKFVYVVCLEKCDDKEKT